MVDIHTPLKSFKNCNLKLSTELQRRPDDDIIFVVVFMDQLPEKVEKYKMRPLGSDGHLLRVTVSIMKKILEVYNPKWSIWAYNL